MFYEGCSERNASYFMKLAHIQPWIGGMAFENWTFPPISHGIFLDVWQVAAKGQSDVVCVCVKQKCGTEFLHTHTHTHTHKCADIHQCLLNVYGDQIVDVSTVRRWVVISAVVTVMWKTSCVPDGRADFSKRRTQDLVDHWWKCVANGGDCVGK